jgi:hypothetical protein
MTIYVSLVVDVPSPVESSEENTALATSFTAFLRHCEAEASAYAVFVPKKL